MDVEITREPRWLQAGASYDLTPFVERALGSAGKVLVADLKNRTSSRGGIRDGWEARPQVQSRDVVLRVVNPHPGARPLNDGAQWPGSMPPWKSGPLAAWAAAHGLNAYLVARALKYGSRTTGRPPGLKAQHWVEDAMAANRDEINNIIAREGVGAWLRALAG